MLVTLLGIVMLVRPKQSANAESPILVTPLPIVMLVRPKQAEKAPPPMLVTGFPSMFAGIISSPDASSAQPVIVTVSPSITYLKLGFSTDTASVGLVSESAFASKPSKGDLLLFSPSHPMRRKAKRGIKHFIFVCDDAEVNFREILQCE